MDIALAVEAIYSPRSSEGAAQYGSADTYDALVATWSDARPIPSLQALADAWNGVQVQRTLDDQAEQGVLSSSLFSLALDEVGDWAVAQNSADFQREMAEAFVLLRQRLLRGR